MTHSGCAGGRAVGLALAILAILAVQSAGVVHGHSGPAATGLLSVSAAVSGAAGVVVAAESPAGESSSACVLCDALRGRVALAEAAPASLDGVVAQSTPRCRPAACPLPSRPELSGSAPRAPPRSA